MDIRARVGRNLRHHRLAQGVSQEEFADRCGLDRTYVSGIERGVRNPTVLILDRLARALGIGVTALLAEEPDPEPGP